MLDPLKEKHHSLYWSLAKAAARESLDPKHQVGCVIVTTSGLVALGWNGTPPGFKNHTRNSDNKTRPCVIHAERNAIDKLTVAGLSPIGAILFTTLAPCVHCALSIQGLGFKEVRFLDHHKNGEGLDLLNMAGIPTHRDHH